MPIKPPPRKVNETENMLRLLLCVDALDSVTSAQLWTFAAEQELMDYVTMRLCLHKLLAAGELELGKGALSERLLLTDLGREALTLFGERLPSDVRERVCGAAPPFRHRLERERYVQASFEIARPNDYRLNLAVQEGDLPTIRLRLETASRMLASKSIHRFRAHAAEVTTYLYGLAEKAVQELPEQMPAPLEGVTEHSAGEFTAHTQIQNERARIEVWLLLPTRRAAEAFILALAEPAMGKQTTQGLLTMITASLRPKRSQTT